MTEATSSDGAADDRKQAFQIDDLVHLEDMFEELGRDDGIQDGIKDGQHEGRVAGLEQGFEMGREVGFYKSGATLWIHLIDRRPDSYPKRLTKVLQGIVELCDAFPTENTPDAEWKEILERIRARWRMATQLLGLGGVQQYDERLASRPRMNY
ncbi:hypothetical protein SmJEL517_g02128 [Synchytrium microbalum]|uniref:Essential protein Yae1 N-terminal domain-containing protein n=1 Tax=Synchytrium microbalum TaxID=1806994 RepID=A0A507C1M7_9FUNG|nr:uncharacterized protein SmJEL517_g02128 [Synchytrium microbalum]TPX35430.1 hypothetical protein SmJEL517_g02128 [Synchytrium microbalum]